MKTSIDIALRYNTLCSVQVSHDYFKDGELKGMSIEPTLETKIWLRNNRFIYRPTKSGFVIGYLAKDGGKLFGKGIDKEKMSFLISTTDNYFDTYTAYDFRKMNEIIYLCNENKGNHLSKSAVISNEDKCPCLPNSFIYNFSKINDNKATVIKDYTMSDVWESSEHQGKTQINLSAEVSGLYHVMEGKKEIQSFYMLPKSPRGLIAVVDLYVKHLPKEKETNYEIKFGAPEAVWRYYFVKYKASTIYERVKIEATKKDIDFSFSTPKQVTIHTGDEAIMIESKKPIIIKENIPFRFQLKAFKKNTQERVTIQLPNPTYKSLTVDKVSKNIFAQIFMKI
jgi:hypothetical protein